VSDSYKKHAKCPDKTGRKKEIKQLSSRMTRRSLKQDIHNCVDWEELVLIERNYIDDDCCGWDYYCDCHYKIPSYNECEVYQHCWVMQFGVERSKMVEGHFSWCNCYSNKKSKYWKAKRK
jgi:hypothetical protein